MDIQYKIATIGLIGALIGGAATLVSSYYVLDQQQKSFNEQELLEQQNIARALYQDITRIEERLTLLNNFMTNSPMNESQRNDPYFIQISDIPIYNSNGLYYVFNKDISEFNRTIAMELYNFYEDITEMENRRVFRNSIAGQIKEKNASLLDIHYAHLYTIELYDGRVSRSFNQAKKLKQELEQKYCADTH